MEPGGQGGSLRWQHLRKEAAATPRLGWPPHRAAGGSACVASTLSRLTPPCPALPFKHPLHTSRGQVARRRPQDGHRRLQRGVPLHRHEVTPCSGWRRPGCLEARGRPAPHPARAGRRRGGSCMPSAVRIMWVAVNPLPLSRPSSQVLEAVGGDGEAPGALDRL